MAHRPSPGRVLGPANGAACLRLSSCSQREHTAERNECPKKYLFMISPYCVGAALLSIFERSVPSVSTTPPHESGSLQNALLYLVHYPKQRVYVKTVFSAFERFDSVLLEWMRWPCHLFVKSERTRARLMQT